VDTQCRSCQRKYSQIRLMWRCPICASEQEVSAPSASANTGSPKLPTFGDCVQAVETRRGYGLSDSETVLLLYAHDIIERQLRASA